MQMLGESSGKAQKDERRNKWNIYIKCTTVQCECKRKVSVVEKCRKTNGGTNGIFGQWSTADYKAGKE